MPAIRPLSSEAAPNLSSTSKPPRSRGDSPAVAPQPPAAVRGATGATATEPAVLDPGVLQAAVVGARSNPHEAQGQPELLRGLDALQQTHSLYWKLNAQILSQACKELESAALQALAAAQGRPRLHAVVAEAARPHATPPEDAA